MICPLCKNDANKDDLIPAPYWQPKPLKLAHKMNPEWNEDDGCCARCFDRIVDAAHTTWEPSQNVGIRGLKDGYRHVLTKRQSGNWHHINPDLQRWWQKKIVNEISQQAREVGFDEWFIFDATEAVLAQGWVTDKSCEEP